MRYKNTSCLILLVEDNKLDADLVQRAIQKADSNVRFDVARDGEDALSYLERWDQGAPVPLIILLDLKLPKVDGLEVLRVLKVHPRYKIIPVIVLTSSNEAENIQRAYDLGANSYILKVVDYDEYAKSLTLLYRYWCELNIQPE